MNTTVFTEMQFWLLVIFSGVLLVEAETRFKAENRDD
jgi:hypothetical protein